MWLRGVEFWVAMAALVMALVTGHWLAALAPAVALAVFEASLLRINEEFGGAPVQLALPVGAVHAAGRRSRPSSPTASSTNASIGAVAPTTSTPTPASPSPLPSRSSRC